VNILFCIFTLLPRRTSRARAGAGAGAGLHLRDVACEQGQQRLRLRGLGGELVVEGEGLDGEGGGPLVLGVANHHRTAFRGTGEAT